MLHVATIWNRVCFLLSIISWQQRVQVWNSTGKISYWSLIGCCTAPWKFSRTTRPPPASPLVLARFAREFRGYAAPAPGSTKPPCYAGYFHVKTSLFRFSHTLSYERFWNTVVFWHILVLVRLSLKVNLVSFVFVSRSKRRTSFKRPCWY